MKKKLNNEELITFCSQMALILKSGISALEGIYIMEEGDVSGDGKEILKELREEIEMCGMLYPAMEKSGVFPEYALHMTEIGEQTGRDDGSTCSLLSERRRNARSSEKCSDISGSNAWYDACDHCCIVCQSYASV